MSTNEYELTEQEQKSIDNFRTQYTEAEKIIKAKQDQLTAIRGALQGALLVIAGQQGLGADVAFSEDFKKIVVKQAVPDEAK